VVGVCTPPPSGIVGIGTVYAAQGAVGGCTVPTRYTIHAYDGEPMQRQAQGQPAAAIDLSWNTNPDTTLVRERALRGPPRVVRAQHTGRRGLRRRGALRHRRPGGWGRDHHVHAAPLRALVLVDGRDSGGGERADRGAAWYHPRSAMALVGACRRRCDHGHRRAAAGCLTTRNDPRRSVASVPHGWAHRWPSSTARSSCRAAAWRPRVSMARPAPTRGSGMARGRNGDAVETGAV
jgi:hypothetical protein